MAADPLLRPNLPARGRIDVFDSNIPRFGNSVFFTVTDARPNIRFNNMVKMIYVPAFWVVTIWFNDKVNNQEWEVEWMLNFLIDYNGTPQFASQILAGVIEDVAPGLDSCDLSGKNWTAEILIRRLSNREVEMYREMGVEFDSDDSPIESFDVFIHDADEEEEHRFNPEKPSYKEAYDCRHTGRRFR
jgi:hypothetical protein